MSNLIKNNLNKLTDKLGALSYNEKYEMTKNVKKARIEGDVNVIYNRYFYGDFKL